jgi:hypothetical protein
MAVQRTIRWAAGVVILLVLASLPGTCIKWESDETAVRAEKRAAEAEQLALWAMRARDSALAAVDSLEARGAQVVTRFVTVRAATPPAPPHVAGCEACEARAQHLEAVLALADSAIAVKDSTITALQGVVVLAEREAVVLRGGLAEARAALAELARPRPSVVVPAWRKFLPTIQGGYGGVLVSGPDGLRVHHGPGVLLGWRIAL